jgi:hypothetical protein
MITARDLVQRRHPHFDSLGLESVSFKSRIRRQCINSLPQLSCSHYLSDTASQPEVRSHWCWIFG